MRAAAGSRRAAVADLAACDVLAAVCHADDADRKGSGVLCQRYCRASWPAWTPDVSVRLVGPPAEPRLTIPVVLTGGRGFVMPGFGAGLVRVYHLLVSLLGAADPRAPMERIDELQQRTARRQ